MSFLLPGYSQLRERPSRGVPEALSEEESSPAQKARANAIQRMLLENRPAPDAFLFVALAANESAPVVMHLPDGGMALALFSSPARAADYSDVQLGGKVGGGIHILSAAGLLDLLRLNQHALGEQLALDRCPRCGVFGVLRFTADWNVEFLLTIRAVIKAQERARLELYLEHAIAAANSGDWLGAKDIALETIGHVTPADPRPHLLLGRVADELGDTTLSEEARHFLEFLQRHGWTEEVARLVSRPFIAPVGDHSASDGIPVTPASVDENAPTKTAPTVVNRAAQQVEPDGSAPIILSPGDLIDEVFRVKEVRRGGMGFVYIVEVDDSRMATAHPRHRFLGMIEGEPAGDRAGRMLSRRWFAIKTLQTATLTPMIHTERFERECLVWATLMPHPNVVRAFSTGRLSGMTPFVLLEYVRGGNLRDRIRNGVTVADALTIALHVCRGMAFLQSSADLVHRDIKPENILMSGAGIPKIADFGLVQIGRPDSTRSPHPFETSVADVALAQDAVIAGSIPYMAPEVLLGLPADVRSDVYSFGVVLYELFSARRPFEHSNFDDYREAHLHDQPRHIDEIANLPPGTGDVVMGCLSKRPQDRIPDFVAIALRLGEIARREGLGAMVPHEVSVEQVHHSMSAGDWQGRGRALMMIGEVLTHRYRENEARPYLERAQAAFERAATLDSDDDYRRGAMGRVLRLLGQHDSAIPYLEAWIAGQHAGPQDYIDLAQSLRQLERHEEVRSVLKQAAARFPESAAVQLEVFHQSRSNENATSAAKLQHEVEPAARGAETAAPSWWKHVVSTIGSLVVPGRAPEVQIAISGWNEERSQYGMRIWRDSHGNLLSLAMTMQSPVLGEDLWRFCDELTPNDGGLIDVRLLWKDKHGAGVAFIYKKLHGSGYRFMGILLWIAKHGASQQWTVVAGEQDGKAGVREATVTAELLNSGAMSREDFDRSWARHPYDPDYPRDAPRLLRFLSDNEEYDHRFPDHPLSVVRSVLAELRRQLADGRTTK